VPPGGIFAKEASKDSWMKGNAMNLSWR